MRAIASDAAVAILLLLCVCVLFCIVAPTFKPTPSVSLIPLHTCVSSRAAPDCAQMAF